MANRRRKGSAATAALWQQWELPDTADEHDVPICEQVEFNLRNCCGCLLLCSLLVFSEAPSCGCFNPFCVSQWQLCCEHLGFLSSSQNSLGKKSLGLRDAFSQPAVACIFPCKYYYICHGPALHHSFVAVMQPGRVASFWFVLIHGTIALGAILASTFDCTSVCFARTDPLPLVFFLCLEQNIRCL